MVHENYHGGSDIFPEILPPGSDKGFPAGENCDKIKRITAELPGKGDGAMVVSVRSLGLSGISGYEVTVECFLSGGLPAFDVVGLPDTAVREARERVRAAVKTCGARFPVSRITVNLAPANQRKEGTVYDLPILLGLLTASEELPPLPEDAAFLGELSLTGALRPVAGVLPMALCAARCGIRKLYVPARNAAEATLADGAHRVPGGNRRPAAGASPGRDAHPAGGAVAAHRRDAAHAGLFRGHGTGEREAGAGDRRRRRTQCAAGGLPRLRQVHAGPAAALHSAGYDPAGVPPDHGDLLCGGADGAQPPAGDPSSLPQPSPHRLPGVPGRRRHDTPAGGDLSGPQRCPVSGRAAGVSTRQRWRPCASLWRTAWSPSPVPPVP